MRQLVELQKQAEQFKKLNAELIFVFREEREGVKGLAKIRARTKTDFTLTVDLNKKTSVAYSSKDGAFDNYVVDRAGIVRRIIPGTKGTRATAEELLKALSEIEANRSGP